jgi:iron complex outermembrane recepter protein
VFRIAKILTSSRSCGGIPPWAACRQWPSLRPCVAALTAAVLVATWPHSVRGQTTPPPPPPTLDSTEEGGLAEVVVTAQKRAESILNVPLSISAIDGGELANRHITGVEDLSRSVPGLSFSAGGSGFGAGEGNTTIEVRGISSSIGSATVGVYLNDAPITTDMIFGTGAFIPSFFDVERVEVLRGPQGTLYGASSEGGTIRFVLTDPDVNKFSGKGSTDVSNTKHGGWNTEETGVVNLPIKEGVLAIRLGGDYSRNRGWVDNYSLTGQLLHQGVNSTTNEAFRLAAKYVVSDDVTIKADLFAQRFTTDDAPTFYLADSEYASNNPTLAPPALPTDGLYRQHAEVTQWGRDTMLAPSLTVDANLGFATLTSVTSGFKREFLRQADGTFYDSYFLAEILSAYATRAQQAALSSQLAFLPSPAIQPVTYRTTSQELRLTSPTPEAGQLPIKWVAGLFFQDQRGNGTQDNPVYNLSTTFQNIFGYGINSPQSPIGDPAVPNFFQPNPKYGDSLYSAIFTTDVKQYAAFGQLDADFLSNLHGALGLRYVHATNNFQVVEAGLFSPSPPTENVGDSANEFTPKASLTYDFSKTSNIYASVAKGFRLGAHWEPLPVGAGNPCQQDYDNLGLHDPKNDYGPDTVWSYEIGTKSRQFNNSLSVNAAAYYLDWKNIQQTMVFPICGYTWVFNAGDARVTGLEYEVLFKPRAISGLTLGVNGAFSHTQFTKSIVPGTIAVGQNIPFVPDYTATASAEYAWPLGDTVNAFVKSDYAYTGQSKGSFVTTSPAYINNAYGQLTASVGVDVRAWRVSVYARNLTDNHTIIQSPVINSLVTGYALQPRTIGLLMSGQF